MQLITWNMQGASHSTENKWQTGVLPLFTAGADVCCLQECGAVPASAKLVSNNYNGIAGLCYYTWGTTRTNKYILFYLADPNGNRCNLAIVSKTAPIAAALVYPAAAPIWRPALGMQLAVNTVVFSLHAISGSGADVLGLLARIIATMGAGMAWTAAGDYNREPSTIAPPGLQVCPPDANTYSTTNPVKKLDYCVKNVGVPVTGSVLNLILSDHFPVGFTL